MYDLPGHYVVETEIGRGGMGTVLRAHDRKHDRKVAIKVLRPEIARSLAHERFLQEIRTVARLVHPNILTVVDSGEAGGTLYFVMPYVEGESLRDRMEREGRLEVGEALRIVGDVAGALKHAHAHGIVHRDVKPENILLSKEGQVWLVDFGIARAVAESDDDARLTSTGLILGSPLYTSPEQASGEKPVDGRSDLYSLGCVLHEALTGAPPFVGTKHAILLQHLTRPAASLRELRPDLPAELDEVVASLLAKNPGERVQTAGELCARLVNLRTRGPETLPQETPAHRSGRRSWPVAMIATGSVVLAITAVSRWTPVRDALRAVGGPAQPPLDSTRYLILRFAGDGDMSVVSPEERLGDAMRGWIGIEVIDQRQAAMMLAEAGTGRQEDTASAIVLARRLSAGRIVQGTVARKDDSLRVALQVIKGDKPNVVLSKITRTIPAAASTLDRSFADLADSLLFRGMAPQCLEGGTSTRNLAALRACDGAFSALEDGEIARADSLFEGALRLDRDYARASLWLAQIRGWVVANPPDTRALVVQALARKQQLTPREQEFALAQQHLGNAQYSAACQIYRRLATQQPADYVAWLGLGECLRRDSVVVRDENRQNWTFRTSYQRAVDAYLQAFRLRPALLAGYRERSFASIRRLLMTSSSAYLAGRTSDHAITFNAYPYWIGDSLAFSPLPAAQFSNIAAGSLPETHAAAIDHQRDVLRDLVRAWASAYPASATAAEGLAVALELQGDRSAIDAMRRARSMPATDQRRLERAAAEVWLLVKFGLPDHHDMLRQARDLADSLLERTRVTSATEARVLLPLAVLAGRTGDAAALARTVAASDPRQLPSGIVEPAYALLAFAAIGAPADSMRRLEAEFEMGLRNGVEPSAQPGVRVDLLWRPTMVAFPVHQLNALPAIAASGAFTTAEHEFSRGDTMAAAQTLRRIDSASAAVRPADLTIDALYVTSWLWTSLGQPQAAMRRLDSTLMSVHWFPPGRLEDAVQIGTLLRATALRAEIAQQLGQRDVARRWATPIAILWQHAAPDLQPLARRMRFLRSSTS